MIEHGIVFITAFLAATILPFYSEVVLFAYLQQGLNPWTLVTVATIGNTLGGAANWALGLYIQRFKDRRWFYFSERQIERAQQWFQRYGIWTLLLAWLPIGGDALTLIAGVMRVRFLWFVLLVGIGKGLRYLAVVGLNGWL